MHLPWLIISTNSTAFTPSALDSLLNWVVSANTFKNRLDRFWQNQEIIYDFKAQLEGTGSRSNL